MSKTREVRSKFFTSLASFGQRFLNTLYPKDFEYYLISFELVDSDGRTVDFFSFPVLPTFYKETYNSLATVRQTFAGINVVTSDTFSPRNITLSGNFGRSFKLLIERDSIYFTGLRFRPRSILTQNFDVAVKSGYGCLKVLEEMVEAASQRDVSGGTYTLIMYNQALGSNYIVIPMSFDQNQDVSSSAIWNYTLNLQGVARVESLNNGKLAADVKPLLVISHIQSVVNNQISGIATGL